MFHTAGKNGRIYDIMRYLRLPRRMLCQAITEFTESRMFAGMDNETAGLLQYTYTRKIDLSATELSNYVKLSKL